MRTGGGKCNKRGQNLTNTFGVKKRHVIVQSVAVVNLYTCGKRANL